MSAIATAAAAGVRGESFYSKTARHVLDGDNSPSSPTPGAPQRGGIQAGGARFFRFAEVWTQHASGKLGEGYTELTTGLKTAVDGINDMSESLLGMMRAIQDLDQQLAGS